MAALSIPEALAQARAHGVSRDDIESHHTAVKLRELCGALCLAAGGTKQELARRLSERLAAEAAQAPGALPTAPALPEIMTELTALRAMVANMKQAQVNRRWNTGFDPSMIPLRPEAENPYFGLGKAECESLGRVWPKNMTFNSDGVLCEPYTWPSMFYDQDVVAVRYFSSRAGVEGPVAVFLRRMWKERCNFPDEVCTQILHALLLIVTSMALRSKCPCFETCTCNRKCTCGQVCICEVYEPSDFFPSIEPQMRALCELVDRAAVRHLSATNAAYAREIQERLEAMSAVKSGYIASFVAKIKHTAKRDRDEGPARTAAKAETVCRHCEAKVQNIRNHLRMCAKKPKKSG